MQVVSDDEWWFLEGNPNGQWAWIEDETALPIAAAIADALEGQSNMTDTAVATLISELADAVIPLDQRWVAAFAACRAGCSCPTSSTRRRRTGGGASSNRQIRCGRRPSTAGGP